MASRKTCKRKSKKATVLSTGKARLFQKVGARDGRELPNGCWDLWLPIVPVPASRPRFSRWGGPYYGKNYTAFRKEAAVLLEQLELPVMFPLLGELEVSVVFTVQKPRTSKRTNPRGDVDNYFKTLDVLNGIIWKDDDQLVEAVMRKEFGETPGISLEVYGGVYSA